MISFLWLASANSFRFIKAAANWLAAANYSCSITHPSGFVNPSAAFFRIYQGVSRDYLRIMPNDLHYAVYYGKIITLKH
jgi:hypothetical protein